MKLKKVVSILAGGAFIMSMGLSMTSCSNKITEEQLLQVKDLKKEERSLQQKLATKKSDLAEVEKEINSLKPLVDDCNSRQKFVQEKLANWPNVWPDWTPEQPEAVAPVVK